MVCLKTRLTGLNLFIVLETAKITRLLQVCGGGGAALSGCLMLQVQQTCSFCENTSWKSELLSRGRSGCVCSHRPFCCLLLEDATLSADASGSVGAVGAGWLDLGHPAGWDLT